MARFEFKYILDPVTANRAKSFVRRMMWLDPYAKERLYTVTSVYFDTPQLTDYYDKSGGFLIRKKLRARIYEHSLNSETEHIWLDIKKKYDMAFIKEHIKITRQDWEDILAHRYTILLSRERPAEEQKVLEEESTGQSKAEAIAEEQTWAKPVYTLNDVEYEAIHPAMPHEKFVKGPARYASEVKATVYVKYRSIAQNLRNITLTRGLMSYLEHVTGITVIKKVK